MTMRLRGSRVDSEATYLITTQGIDFAYKCVRMAVVRYFLLGN